MDAKTPTRPRWLDGRLYPFQDRYMDLHGHRIHYLDEGEGPVQLLVHPGPGWSFMFRRYILRLRDRFRCVAPDLPGWGLSSVAPGFRVTVPNLAGVLEGFIERLDLHGITAWAGDSSGPFTMMAAERVPERIQGFVLNGTFVWPLNEYPKVERYLGFVTGRLFRSANRRLNVIPRLLAGIALGSRRQSRPEGRHYRKAFPTRAHRDRIIDLFAASMDHEALRETHRALDRIRDRPTLLVFGERDATVRFGFYERLRREFPNHEAHLIPRARHFAFEDSPDAVLPIFEEWWRRLTVPSSARGIAERAHLASLGQ